MDTAETIRRARRAAGLTQRGLSESSGVTQPSIAAYETGRVTPTGQTLERLLAACHQRPSQALTRHREAVIETIAGAGGRDVRVFGSIARGDDRIGSDVDLLVHLPEDMGMFDLVDLEQRLEDLLGVGVDIVDDQGASRVLEQARAEAIPL